jgi:ribosomal protein S18 acetylase RimI-like enzyme
MIEQLNLCDRKYISKQLEDLTYQNIEYSDINETYGIIVMNMLNIPVMSSVLTADISVHKLPSQQKKHLCSIGVTKDDLCNTFIEVSFLCTHSTFRISGVAQSVLKALVHMRKGILLYVAGGDTNKNAINFYKYFGFVLGGFTKSGHTFMVYDPKNIFLHFV